MAILLIMVYVFIGVAIGATYYYLQLKADKYDKDVFNSVLATIYCWTISRMEVK